MACLTCTVGVLFSQTAAGQPLCKDSSRQRSPWAPSGLGHCQPCNSGRPVEHFLNVGNTLIVTGHLAVLVEVQTQYTQTLPERILDQR